MAVVGVPGWIGSSAVSETGQRWMSAAAGQLRLGLPVWMSRFAGVSREQTITIGANYSYAWSTLVNQIQSMGVSGGAFRINVVGTIVSNSAGAPCLYFPSSLAGVDYIDLVINGGVGVMGRGGAGGGDNTGGPYSSGENGGVGITNEIGGKLRITNNGWISGGGGGGGLVNMPTSTSRRVNVSGGGGRPFGAGGTGGCEGNGSAASLDAPGAGVSTSLAQSGAGGNLGAAGQYPPRADGRLDPYPGGAAGAAVNGNAPSWVALGTIYGSRV